jgi:hypothetical protein
VTEPVVDKNNRRLQDAPSPADLVAKATQELRQEEAEKPARSPDDLQAEIAKLRKENANWRTKYREAEPIVAKASGDGRGAED